MNALILFLKGIVAGIGGIAPGLSGSVLLVILGLYEQAVHAIGTLFLDFKKNIRFLLPLVAGFGAGILLFSKVVDYLLLHWELYTRFAFLGLIVGTIPLFYREVKKKGFRRWRHLPVIVLSAIAGTFLFGVNKGLFPVLTNATFWQSVLLGVCVAGSSVVPGVDSAAILSALGLYELYVHALAEFNLQILLPAAGGLVIGAAIISTLMNLLLKNFYTMTFSVIFGLFLSIVPHVLNGSCVPATVPQGVIAFVLVVVGCGISYYLGDIPGNNQKLERLFGRK